MPLPMGVSQWVVPVGRETREAAFAFACAHGYGVEVSDFFLPATLDSPEQCAGLVEWIGSWGWFSR